jgi:hypothetical protein
VLPVKDKTRFTLQIFVFDKRKDSSDEPKSVIWEFDT